MTAATATAHGGDDDSGDHNDDNGTIAMVFNLDLRTMVVQRYITRLNLTGGMSVSLFFQGGEDGGGGGGGSGGRRKRERQRGQRGASPVDGDGVGTRQRAVPRELLALGPPSSLADPLSWGGDNDVDGKCGGYEDDGDDGDESDDDGGDGGEDDAKRRQTQESNIKPTSTVRTLVVMTARATTKAARAAMVAGATRRMATMVMTAAMAATITPNGDKDNEDGISRRQQRKDIIHRIKSAGKCDRQLISPGGTSRRLSPFVGVGAGLTSTSLVSIGKDGGPDRLLCWGWRGGIADYWGTKNKKGEGENLACGWG